jgi:hypothetical protein
MIFKTLVYMLVILSVLLRQSDAFFGLGRHATTASSGSATLQPLQCQMQMAMVFLMAQAWRPVRMCLFHLEVLVGKARPLVKQLARLQAASLMQCLVIQ